MSRRAIDPMARAVAAYRELTPQQRETFMYAVALSGTLDQIAPEPRKRKAKEAPPNGQ